MGNLKTYTMTLFTVLDHKAGRPIYSNYDLTLPHKEIYSLEDLVSKFPEMNGATVCLDEFQVWWDCYTTPKEKDGSQAFKNFARQVRKRGIKVYFTAQDYYDIPRALRKVVQYVYVTRKLHLDYTECQSDSCTKDHLLELTPSVSMGNKMMLGKSCFYHVDRRVFNIYNTKQVIMK
jgi:hypothetical protein